MAEGDNLVEIEFKMPNYMERFKSQFNRLMIAIASDVQTNRGLLFDAEGAYSAHDKWRDLKTGENKKFGKNGLQMRQILRRSGALKNSIAPMSQDGKSGPGGYVNFSGDVKNAVVAVGTNLKYARIHDQGGIIQHPGTKNGFGRGIKIKPHRINMPKRNFTGWNRVDNRNLEKVIANTIAEILNGR